MAEAKPSGKGSYVSLRMEGVKDNLKSDDEQERRENVPIEKDRDLMTGMLDQFDEVFRRKVRSLYDPKKGISWSHAADEVTIELLFERYKDGGKKSCDDPFLVLLKEWPVNEKFCYNPRVIEPKINRLVKIILNDSTAERYGFPKDKYEFFRDDSDQSEKTPLHLVAELNYSSVAKTILLSYPDQLYITTNEPGERCTPLELALMKYNDDVSAFLVGQMIPERVSMLFSCDIQESPVRFQELVEHHNMKATQSLNIQRDIELAWSSEPNEPISYQFHYQILEADECGRDPKHVRFNWKSKSCLLSIADSKNKGAIHHPALRQLVKKKWNEYAHFWFSVMFVFYVVFLFLLSVALLHASIRDDPAQYDGWPDTLRLTCEVVVLISVMIFVVDEISEMRRERLRYVTGVQLWYNLFDWFGLSFILIVIPLRFAHHNGQWIVASLAFTFNVLRLFKYSCVSRRTGLYTRTLAKIIFRDVIRFTGVFIVVFFAFCGAFYLSLRATGAVQVFGGSGKVLLSGVRALVEQQPADEDYTKYRAFPVLVILLYMTAVVVILLNILIAQMSCTYTEARNHARLQYDVDRMCIITRLEQSLLLKLLFRTLRQDKLLQNLRQRYYKEEETIDEMTLARDLLEDNEDRVPWESIEDTLEDIRNIMRKILRRMPLSNADK